MPSPWQLFALLFTPSIYIFLSCACLAQFRIIFNTLSTAAYHMQRGPLEAFAPIVKTFVQYLESIFGPAYKFVPNPTHVLLVALMLAVIANRS